MLVAKYFLVTFIAEKCNRICLIHAITLKQQFKNRYMVVCYSNSNMDTIAVGEITYLLRILKYLTSFPCKHIYGLVWVFFLVFDLHKNKLIFINIWRTDKTHTVVTD